MPVNIELKVCNQDIQEKMKTFYRDVSHNTEGISAFGRWNYGVYPKDEIISEYISRSQMYCLYENRDIIAAVALTNQDESYHKLNWGIDLQDEEVTVVHLLAVNPKRQHQGLAGLLLEMVIENARNMGKKAVRLDALSCNIPVHRLYESLGFVKRDICNWYADNTGYIDFFLFELIL